MRCAANAQKDTGKTRNPDWMHTLQPHGYRRGAAIWITAGRVCVFSCEFNGVCPQGGVSVRTREPSEITPNPACLCFPVSRFPSPSQSEPSWSLFMEPSRHRHHHLLRTVSAIYRLIDASPSSAGRVCVSGQDVIYLQARAQECDSVCWQLNQRGLDE